ncbi:MAG TPA: acyl-CoA thioesterase [Trueperaceae bacterium]|nr:acyl-CoA thioesterase [Trueperaceae bacterium]HRP47317.1 acyl-CoA thioesterase [Trueperaceae bacterium]
MPHDPSTPRSSDWVISVSTAFPNMANPLGTLFGGHVLELMDMGAAVAAQRFCRNPVVTASTEPIDFRNPIHVGEIIELKCRVAWTGRTSMIVRCEVHGENPLTGERRLCTIGHLNFVALGADGRPTPVPELKLETDIQQRHWETGQRVRDDLERRRARKAYEPT